MGRNEEFEFRQRKRKKAEKDVRQESKTLALIWVSSLRVDRSAWIAFLAFNFSHTKRLELKSSSWSFQSATMTRVAQIFNMQKQRRMSAWRSSLHSEKFERKNIKKLGEAGRTKALERRTTETNMRGPPPSVHNYVWSPYCSLSTP